jgi:hypothetical protein
MWMGFGMEFSVFVLWAGWAALHSRVAHRLDPEHIFHKIAQYFE